MRRTIAFTALLVTLGVSGCKGKDGAEPGAQPTAASASASAAASGGSAAALARRIAQSPGPKPFDLGDPIGFTAVRRPEQVACLLGSDRYSPSARGAVSLYADDQGPLFGNVWPGAAVRLLVGVGNRPSVVEAESEGVFLRGRLRPPATGGEGDPLRGVLALHPADAFRVAGVLVPKPNARLVWQRASAGKLVVAPLDAADPKAKQALKWESEQPCETLSLDMQEFDPRRIMTNLEMLREAHVASSSAVPLAASPGGKPVLQLSSTGDQSALVAVHAEQRDQVLITWHRMSEVVHGWVPANALSVEPAVGLGGLGLSGIGHGGGGFGRGRSNQEDVVCDKQIRLLVDLYAKSEEPIRPRGRYVVGGFRPGTRIRISRRAGEYTYVFMHGATPNLSFGGEPYFMVFSADLEGCRQVPLTMPDAGQQDP